MKNQFVCSKITISLKGVIHLFTQCMQNVANDRPYYINSMNSRGDIETSSERIIVKM